MKKLLIVSQNQAPFRLKWADELAKYMQVYFYHLNQYERDVNKKYISYKAKRAIVKDISFSFLKFKHYNLSEIKKIKYDILILDGYGFRAQMELIFWLRIMNKPYGLSIDGAFIPQNENIIKRQIKKSIISNAAFVFSTSQCTDEFITNYGGEKKRIYRHLFSNTSISELADKPLRNNEKILLRKILYQKYGIQMQASDPLVVSAGKLIYRKGFDVLEKAIIEMNSEDNITNCIIVGSSDKSDSLKIGEGKNIDVIAYCDKEELNLFYKAADIFVLPTRHDEWGLVIGEAMAQGAPIITTEMCLAGRALIQDKVNGYLVPADDVEALKRTIDIILQSDLYAIGVNNIKKIYNYTIEKSAESDSEFILNKAGQWK